MSLNGYDGIVNYISGLDTRLDTAESDIDTLETGKADKATTLAGYGINDAYTKTEVDTALGAKMDKNNPTGTGSLSINRKSGTTVGTKSATLGDNGTATGQNSLALGDNTSATNWNSIAEGTHSIASGDTSHAEGRWTIARGNYQHAQGQFNVEDTGSLYADIVGNGTSSVRKNIEATTWTGDKKLKGDVYVGCNDDSTGGSKLAKVSEIPTELSQLSADSTHRLVTDSEKSTWSGKQDAISDLETIRSGAGLGATSVQPADIANDVEAYDAEDVQQITSGWTLLWENASPSTGMNSDTKLLDIPSGYKDIAILAKFAAASDLNFLVPNIIEANGKMIFMMCPHPTLSDNARTFRKAKIVDGALYVGNGITQWGSTVTEVAPASCVPIYVYGRK